MHILIIPSWYPSSPEDISGCFFREQALALNKYGHQVGVVDIKLRLPGTLKLLFNDFFGTNVEFDEGMLTYRSCSMDWFRLMPGLRRWLWLYHGRKLVDRYVSRHGKPEVIHAHSMLNGGILAKESSEKLAVPFIVTEHSSAFTTGTISQQQLEIARSVAASAARRYAVSEALCTLLKSELDASLSWEEMPNMVDQNFVESELTAQHRMTGSFVFLSVALLTENKQIHYLISAFAREFGSDQEVILRLGGDGPERLRLEALAVKLGVADRVFFLGLLSRDQVLEEISKSSVFVLPSRYETFGVVVVEALALGKPVVATRCGGPESIVRDEDGILVPTGDIPALGDAMKEIRLNYDRYDPSEIRAACIARYSESTIAARLTVEYSKVLSNQR